MAYLSLKHLKLSAKALKIDGWKSMLLFGTGLIFRGHVTFWECYVLDPG